MAGMLPLADGWRLYERPKAKQRRGCARKVRHETEAASMADGKNWGHRAFRCRVCGYWHLTSEPPRHP